MSKEPEGIACDWHINTPQSTETSPTLLGWNLPLVPQIGTPAGFDITSPPTGRRKENGDKNSIQAEKSPRRRAASSRLIPVIDGISARGGKVTRRARVEAPL